MERHLILDFVRVTEAAALAAAHHMGQGDNEAADRAAVEAMRRAMGELDLRGVRLFGGGARTHSLAMTRQSGEIRFVDGIHLADRSRVGAVQL